MPRASSYRIGWICAINIEYVAACALLDVEYETPVDAPCDDNTYTFGRFGRHHVVVACLHESKYGTTAATKVAATMVCSFRSIELYLMVGIAGGVPSEKHDIRLGDVVVSVPDNDRRETGVIRHRRGKNIQGKNFRRTGVLRAPPDELLGAITQLKKRHKFRHHRIQKTVANALDRHKSLTDDFAKPDSSSDILFRSTFTHGDEKRSCMNTCVLTQEEIVFRRHRTQPDKDPIVHYGSIASSDELLKDAIVRDELAQELDVLCVETEAAGLMDTVHCLVVRGICDYADTHKNDRWQARAAIHAAAYAKELIEVLRGGTVDPSNNQNTSEPVSDVLLSEDQVAVSQISSSEIESTFNCSVFDQLETTPLYVIPGNSQDVRIWDRMTLFSYMTYEEIYETMTSDDKAGYVSLEAFQKQISNVSERERVVKYRSLFKPAYQANLLSKSHAMALLFMLHMCRYVRYDCWARCVFKPKHLSNLERFDKWVKCSCKQKCGLAWSFINGGGLCRRITSTALQQECAALNWVRLGRPEEPPTEALRPGRQADARNKRKWDS